MTKRVRLGEPLEEDVQIWTPDMIKVTLADLLTHPTDKTRDIVATYIGPSLSRVLRKREAAFRTKVDECAQSMSGLLQKLALVAHETEHVMTRLREACGPAGMFDDLYRRLLAQPDLLPLCFLLSPAEDEGSSSNDDISQKGLIEQLLGEPIHRQQVVSRQEQMPRLSRSMTCRGLFLICSSFLTSLELARSLARTNRAWFLYLRRNLYACAGSIVPFSNVMWKCDKDPLRYHRWRWLRKSSFLPVAVHVNLATHSDGESISLGDNTFSRVTSIEVLPADLSALSSTHFQRLPSVRRVVIRGSCTLWTGALQYASSEFKSWWAALNVLDAHVCHGKQYDDPTSSLFPTLTSYSDTGWTLAAAIQSPPLLRIYASMHSYVDAREVFRAVMSRIDAGTCSGLQRIEAYVHYDCKPSFFKADFVVPRQVTVRVTCGSAGNKEVLLQAQGVQGQVVTARTLA